MPAVSAQRCLHHVTREAVARCPECGHFYCRECITEHEDRIICSSCLRKLSAKPEVKRQNFAPVGRILATACGILLAWIFFFLAGQMLANIPTSFHEGTVWESDFMNGGGE